MIMYLAALFIAGLLFGSFANVCIHRIPLDQSIVKPRSRCPSCGTMIAWHDNIPVISYLLLRARCRACGIPISVRYPIVEIATGTAFLFVGLRFGWDCRIPLYLFFVFSLIVVSMIDLDHRIIPDAFSLSLLVAGLLASPFNGSLGASLIERIVSSAGGVILGGGSLLLIGFIAEKIFKKEAMGGGDIKLLAGIGAVLGYAPVFPILFGASLLGSFVGIGLILSKRIGRREYIPFGPFIAAAALLALLTRWELLLPLP